MTLVEYIQQQVKLTHWGGAEAFADLVIHNSSHGGEIAALKGFQGLQGQPV